MLTTDDIRNPTRASGFDHVSLRRNSPSKGRYVANVYSKIVARDRSGRVWQGPRRATAEEAAQDYCDYVNGRPIATPKRLKTAGHKRDTRPRSQRTKRSAKQLAKQGLIYCVSDGEYVKIGWTSRKTVTGRLAEMQTGNARVLFLIGVKPGTLGDEGALHQKYIKQNVLQEWFLPSSALLKEFE